MDAYFGVKSRLFNGGAGHAPRAAAINIDDAHGRALVAATPLFRRIPGVSYRVALMQIREGQYAEAAKMLSLGAEFAIEANVRAQYQQVLAALAQSTKPPPEKE